MEKYQIKNLLILGRDDVIKRLRDTILDDFVTIGNFDKETEQELRMSNLALFRCKNGSMRILKSRYFNK